MSFIHTLKRVSFNLFINSVSLSKKQTVIQQLLKRKRLVKIDIIKVLSKINHDNFIIIGANDGLSFDTTFKYFIQNFKHGVLIEPHPYYFNLLQKNILELNSKNNITLVNKAIAGEPFSLYAVRSGSLEKYPDWIRGSSSFNSEHLLKYGVNNNDIEKINVQNIAVNELLKPFMNVNYLQIDTEGYDYFIIKDIDFSKTTFDIIKFENVNLNEGQKEHLYNLLSSKKFLILEDGIDSYAVSEKVQIKFL